MAAIEIYDGCSDADLIANVMFLLLSFTSWATLYFEVALRVFRLVIMTQRWVGIARPALQLCVSAMTIMISLLSFRWNQCMIAFILFDSTFAVRD
jgi:hypothetical protein